MALFDKTVRYLMEHGARFKFTGGEPTLNRHLALMLKVVKSYGGIVFLDSNGSRPKIIRELVDDGLAVVRRVLSRLGVLSLLDGDDVFDGD